MEGGVRISENDDLNDYINPGTYFSAKASISNTLKNCPFTTSGFMMTVYYSTGNDPAYITQEIHTANKTYTRSMSNNVFSDEWNYFSDDATVLGNGMARSLIRVQCTANTTTVINSDTATVVAGKLPEKRQTYIPVVVGHYGTNACIDNVYYDSSGGWLVYTTYSQYVTIMFYDVSKITHVETSA